MRVLIYARVSQDPRGDHRSVTEQEHECRAWASREGWRITKVIAETGSASRYARSTRSRSRWDEVTAELQTGAYDVLMVWEASRATRDLTAFTSLRDLCAAHSVQLGYSGALYDLTDRADRFRTGLDALLAEDESARTSERIQRSVRARAAAGRPHGKILYGYRREYDPATGQLLRQVPDETRAPVVHEVTQRVADGETLYGIATDLTRRGIPLPRPPRTRPTQSWSSTSIKRLATNPAYAGIRIHRGAIVGAADWPPIVTPELQERAAAAIAAMTATNPTGNRRAVHLLSGIAKCGLCGGGLRVVSNRGTRSYNCRWCLRLTRKADAVDEYVVATLTHLLTDLTTVDDDTAHEALTEARRALTALEDRLEAFTEQAVMGQLSAATLAKVEARLRPQIATSRRQLRALMAPKALAAYDLSDPVALWDSMAGDTGGRRELIAAAVTVRLHPVGRGRRSFVPSSVEVTPNW